MPSPYLFGKTSGLSTVVKIIVAFGVVAGLVAILFLASPQTPASSDLETFDNFGVTFSYPNSLRFLTKEDVAGMPDPTYETGIMSLVLREGRRGPDIVITFAWLPAGNLTEAQAADLLQRMNEEQALRFGTNPLYSNVELGTLRNFEVQGRPGTLRDGMSLVIQGAERAVLEALWYDSSTDRLFQFDAIYSEEESSTVREIFGSIRMDS